MKPCLAEPASPFFQRRLNAGLVLLRTARWGTGSAVLGLVLTIAGFLVGSSMRAHCAEEPNSAGIREDTSNKFPDPAEIFQGRSFESKTARDIYFLKRIRRDFSDHWPSLLEANINLQDYLSAPDKLLRFVNELGSAAAQTDDAAAITNLRAITSDPRYYANPDAYRPEVLRSAASALIKIGPKGREALAETFTEVRYSVDPVSLELFAQAIGESRSGDTNLISALAAAAFTFTATNGGSYPKCTGEVTGQLLSLPAGEAFVADHLNAKELFKDPGRFHAVVDAIPEAHAFGLASNLSLINAEMTAKIKTLAGHPGPYLDDLAELQLRTAKAITRLQNGTTNDSAARH